MTAHDVATKERGSYYEDYWNTGDRARHIGDIDDAHYGAVRKLVERYAASAVACLDVGCGDGLPIGAWMHHTGRQYIGVDISETAVAKARNEGLDARVISDASELPFPDGSFDLVVSSEVLEHLFLPQQAAAEMVRVLRPGGTLIITVPNTAALARRARLALGQWDPYGDPLSISRPWRDPHVRFFTRGALSQMLSEVGLRRVYVGGHSVSITGVQAVWRPAGLPLAGKPYNWMLWRVHLMERRLTPFWPSLLADRLHGVGWK